ncbi:uncharacterized protein J8A68_002932 [[Candida] subhashii]|uniref:Uncharacterized protein n=1 Tax=[Candida] subhashii TaxID=561895 RepID=A0A8J5QNG5_9ASCO|nr:uncharacterized protein J8A68_002932 [[Candida] subhashii]KAG7663548.1 hypothetical protein J8A68_002932 [[Candida] subhashii]
MPDLYHHHHGANNNKKLSGLLTRLYEKIDEVDGLKSHLQYVSRINYSEELIIMFHVHYLIARISRNLYSGIIKPNSLTVDILQSLIKQANTWINDSGLERINNQTWKLEILLMLNYFRYFMRYLLLLQSEENVDLDMIENIIPEIFTNLYMMIKQFHELVDDDNGSSQWEYLLSAIIELLTRSIQFIIGLITRIKCDDEAGLIQEATFRKHCPERIGTEFGLKTPVEYMNKIVVEEITITINKLEKIMKNKDRIFKLSKLWKFYLTFISSDKIGKFNYAKLHAGIPEFNGVGKSGLECPVIKVESIDQARVRNTTTTSTTKKVSACPISHITTPMSEEEVMNGGGGSPRSDKPNATKKRKCPFDHNNLSRTMSSYSNPIESNIRGGEHFRRASENNSPATPIVNANTSRSILPALPPGNNMYVPTTSTGTTPISFAPSTPIGMPGANRMGSIDIRPPPQVLSQPMAMVQQQQQPQMNMVENGSGFNNDLDSIFGDLSNQFNDLNDFDLDWLDQISGNNGFMRSGGVGGVEQYFQ